jgi:hypothetical protein
VGEIRMRIEIRLTKVTLRGVYVSGKEGFEVVAAYEWGNAGVNVYATFTDENEAREWGENCPIDEFPKGIYRVEIV